MNPQLFEILKAVLSLLGALLIAWLAVRWALKRYKAEKLWDRQLSAYADVISAIAHLEELNRLWFEESLGAHDAPVEQQAQRTASYQAARRQVFDALALARILWPRSSQDIVAELQRWFERADLEMRPADGGKYLEEGAVVGKALIELVIEARSVLGLHERERGG